MTDNLPAVIEDVPTGTKNTAVMGRPPKYQEEFCEQAYKLCLLGATDQKLADFFGVHIDTIDLWKRSKPDFIRSIRAGKDEADANVAKSLYKRALGYEAPDTHVSVFQGEVTLTPIQKHYPPETPAAIFWLKNRQRHLWRDRQEVDHSGEVSLGSLIGTAFGALIDVTPDNAAAVPVTETAAPDSSGALESSPPDGGEDGAPE